MKRRTFLGSTALPAVLATAGCVQQQPTSPGVTAGSNPFQHGVASGDPTQERVILWTRVSPADASAAAPERAVSWWIGERESGEQPAASGQLSTSAERDFTVKVDAAGLTPGTRYFYGFEADGWRSPVGRTRTAPSGSVSDLRFAVTSCANHPQGYFNAYRAIADDDSLTAVFNLGDYLYEYANDTYGDGTALGRVPAPDREIVSLADYRTRHAQYKSDPDLQDAHAAHPWLVVWDDHESANNAWAGGAENHTEGAEGEWSVRKAAAVRAYYEWMPVREVPTGLYRTFRYGDLASIAMLDARLVGRDEQGAGDDHDLANATERTLLGPIQERDFLAHLSEEQAAGVRWKLVGQQVVFAPWTDGKAPFNPDSWDGYRASRQRVIDHIVDGQISDVVILSGDVHSSWGMEVPAGDDNCALEFVAPAVSSPALATASPRARELFDNAAAIEHVRYADGDHNGYLFLHLNAERVRAEWRFTGARDVRSGETRLGGAVEGATGSNRLS